MGTVRRRYDYDPSDDLRRLETPTLVVLGENDPLVHVAVSVRHYRETAVRSERTQRILVLPDADHRIRTKGGFAPGYLDSISKWCIADDEQLSTR